MKCNPNPKLMDLMCSLPGMCVDCAGVEEINMCLDRGIKPDHIIFANPIKSVEGIECMRKNGIWTGTVDSIEEVQKMHDVLGDDAKHCRIVIRLWVDDSHSIIALGSKFGCHLSEVRGILNQVKLCGMEAVGVAFHVGTGNEDLYAYEKAVRDSAEVFNMAKEFGFTMTLLDLGGGWAGDLGNDAFENPSLTNVCGIIRDAIKKHEVFNTEGFRMISEPGRYFNNNTVSVACKVLNAGKREGRSVYKINEGVMGVFHDLILCDMSFKVEPLVEGEKKPASIIGSSIMQKDVVLSEIDLPEMKVGDIILFKNIGAYSVSLTTLPLRRNQDHVYVVRRSSLSQH